MKVNNPIVADILIGEISYKGVVEQLNHRRNYND